MSKIEALRKIVAECQCATVDGVLVDLYSASAVVAVYDKLSPTNQAKYLTMPVAKMAEVAFKLAKGA